MAKLITDANEAEVALKAAEIDMDGTPTRKEVMVAIDNYFKANIRPTIVQQNQIALLLNHLLDFLVAIGLHKSSSGRLFRLHQEEFKEFIKTRMTRQQQPEAPSTSEPAAKPN